MRVSVVIPCFNGARTIAEAIRSAAAQTAPPHEIVVVDDGSTDDSRRIIASCGADVALLQTTRAGAAGARNAGIRAATGDFIAYLDADDVWLPHHLARAAELLRGTGDVAYMAHWERFAEARPVEQFAPLPVGGRPTTGLSHGLFFHWFSRWRYFCHGGVVERRDAALDAGLFDESLERRHDFDLFLRVIHGRTWAYDPRIGWRYRADTPGALSRDVVRCQYFFLRGLLKHRSGYAGPDMERMLRVQARSALAAAFTDGDAADRGRAWELAAPLLGPADRLAFLAARRCPSLFRRLNRLRRRARAL